MHAVGSCARIAFTEPNAARSIRGADDDGSLLEGLPLVEAMES